ncbi:MAG: hypothetical protein LCH84_09790 [Gemmatimonadetes bacterium]|nr:hypothetical protein [Gemmatimonadota bacterium]
MSLTCAALMCAALMCVALSAPGVAAAQPTPTDATVQLRAGRFTVLATPGDARLARTLLTAAQARDTFPGLPRPTAAVRIAIAPDAARFRAWVGEGAPEWGAAIAFPDAQYIVMQGRTAGSDAGDPLVVLRHELAHLALHEAMGPLPPRWFDEGYASVSAGEFTREQLFETTFGMVWRTLPSLEALERGFVGGGVEAGWSYAMAHRVVSELEQLGGSGGLANFFAYWKASGSFEKAIRGAFGMTGEAFEKHWQRQTRRRYGALSVVTNVTAAVGMFGVVLLPLFLQKRRRDRRRLEAMRAADAAQEAAARASALQALLDATGAGTADGASAAAAMGAADQASPTVPAPLPPSGGDRYPPA